MATLPRLNYKYHSKDFLVTYLPQICEMIIMKKRKKRANPSRPARFPLFVYPVRQRIRHILHHFRVHRRSVPIAGFRDRALDPRRHLRQIKLLPFGYQCCNHLRTINISTLAFWQGQCQLSFLIAVITPDHHSVCSTYRSYRSLSAPNLTQHPAGATMQAQGCGQRASAAPRSVPRSPPGTAINRSEAHPWPVQQFWLEKTPRTTVPR